MCLGFEDSQFLSFFVLNIFSFPVLIPELGCIVFNSVAFCSILLRYLELCCILFNYVAFCSILLHSVQFGCILFISVAFSPLCFNPTTVP
jgi:hypothetical protein